MIMVLKIFYVSQKHNTVFYTSYKKFDDTNFRRQLNMELLNFVVNNIELKTFCSIFCWC